MERGKLKLNNPERFAGVYEIPMEKVDAAIEKACGKIAANIDKYKSSFIQNNYKRPDTYVYDWGENNSWITGMQTGSLVLAYELTKDQKFLDAALSHLPSYRHRVDTKLKMQDHDVGFFMCPSCVALYKLTGNEEARRIALDAAEYFYDYSYSEKGGFILLVADGIPYIGVRTIMDTVINSPLLLWAGLETGNQKYIDAGVSQITTTEKYLMRADGSTYHHFLFDTDTYEPVRGLTYQGNRDESCWGRGHTWGLMGVPVVYEYNHDPKLIAMHHDLAYYLLNHLPEDNVLYWDFDFTSGDEARDSSSCVIAATGLMDMAYQLPDSSPDKQIYRNAAAMMLEAVIDNYTGDIGRPYDGLIWGVTGAKNLCVETCGTYGDYPYLEALVRYKNPAFKRLR